MYKLEKIGSFCIGSDNMSIYKNPNLKIVEYIKTCGLDLVTMNRRFDACDQFKKCFGILYQKGFNSIMILDLDSRHAVHLDNDLSENFTKPAQHWTKRHYRFLNLVDSLKFERLGSSNLMCLYFNADGNFVNRDHNINLNTFTDEVYTIENLVEEFKSFVELKIGNNIMFSESEQSYLTDEYYIKQYYYNDKFTFEFIKKRQNKNDYQNYKGEPIYKKPKNTVDINFETFWEKTFNKNLCNLKLK